MKEINYLPQNEVDNLHERVEENLKWYYKGAGATPMHPRVRIRKARLAMAHRSCGALEPSSSSDAENARKVFVTFRGLSRNQAADERLWVHLCHSEYADYVRKRWLVKQRTKTGQIQAVRNHFFARTNRAVFRDNGVSRLWWLGRVAEDIAELGGDPDSFLEIVLHRQDIRSAILERPSTTMNPRVLKGLYEVMREHWRDEERRLFRRNVFRTWMKALNREGGVVLLDGLSDSKLENLAAVHAEAALKTASG